MNIFVSKDLNCAYRLNNNQLEWADLYCEIFDDSDFGCVDSSDENVRFMDTDTSLNDVYKYVRKQLTIRS